MPPKPSRRSAAPKPREAIVKTPKKVIARVTRAKRLSLERQFADIKEGAESKTQQIIGRPRTRLSDQLANSRKTRSTIKSSNPLVKKPKSTTTVEVPIVYLKRWESLSQPIPNVTETDTKNWRTVTQIKLAITSIIYDKITNEKLTINDAIKFVQNIVQQKGGTLLENLKIEFEKITKKPGKNLLVGLAIVVGGEGYKIIDISLPNKLLQYLDHEDQATVEVLTSGNQDINPQRDFHTEAAICAHLPKIIRKSMIDLGYKFSRNGKILSDKSVEKVYVYIDSIKSACNSCVGKIRFTQEENYDLPLSFIFNYHQIFSGAAGAIPSDSDSCGSPDHEEPKDEDLQTPIKTHRQSYLQRGTPQHTYRSSARQIANQLIAMPFQLSAYVSGSIQTGRNSEIEKTINQKSSIINNLIADAVKKVFGLTLNTSQPRGSRLQQTAEHTQG